MCLLLYIEVCFNFLFQYFEQHLVGFLDLEQQMLQPLVNHYFLLQFQLWVLWLQTKEKFIDDNLISITLFLVCLTDL